MEVRNLLTIIESNFRLIFKRTLIPAAVILLIVPQIYGISNLDSVKSADCLERMAALIGLPMFVTLLKPEQSGGIDAIINLRPFPYRITAALRIGISLTGTVALIVIFEGFMGFSGCSFPAYSYTFRTLAQSVMLGFPGLLASAVSKSTAPGFLVSFCWYFVLQAEGISSLFKTVSNGVGIYQILLLAGCGIAVIFFSRRAPET